jgi:ABC-type uncharacterized transport system involved in gliding motility auxiliary subunit
MNLKNNNILQLVGAAAGVLGLLLAFAAVGYGVITNLWDIPRYLLIGALALEVVFVFLNPEMIYSAITGRGTRFGVNALLRVLAAFGIAIALYAIWGLLAPRIGSGFGRLDVTANKAYTLDNQTINALNSLPGPVKAIGFFPAGDAGQQEADNLLKEYRAHTDKIQVQYIDPIQDPFTANQYNVTRSGVVVFDNGTRKETATSNTQEEFTKALLRLRETGTKTIAILDVPSIASFSGGSQDQRPLSLAYNELSQQNYTILPQPYNVAISPTISISDVTVLIVPPVDPQRPMSDAQVRAVADYLDRGGHVLLMGDPEAAPLPPALLQKYGLTEYHDVILESNQANVWSAAPFNIMVSSYGSSTITKDMGSLRTFYSAVESIQPPTSTITGFVSTAVVQSSSTSLLAKIVPGENGQQGQLVPDDKAPPAPLTMIVSVEQDVPPATGTVTTTTQPTQTQGMRLVVTGDVDFASDPLVQQLNATTNLDLFTNIVNWLSESEDRISIPTPSTTAPTLTLGLAEQQLTFYTTVVILPLLVLLIGGFIWWRRR